MTKRLLLVEDNKTLWDLYTQCLQELNLDIHIAGNGMEALDKITCENYDLCIVDLFLPDMTGFDVIKAIKKKDSNAHILAVTAAATDSIIGKAIESGATAILKKPFTLKELRESVKMLKGGDDNN